MQYFEKYWIYFHQTCALWDKYERFKFRGQKVKFKVTVGPKVMENALLALLRDILKITELNFTKLSAMMHLRQE